MHVIGRRGVRYLSLAGFLTFSPLGIFYGAQAQVQSPTQTTTVNAQSVDISLLPQSSSAPSGANVEIPAPRIPIGRARLRQLKQSAPTMAPGAVTLAAAAAKAAQKETVATNCVTNAATSFTPSDIHGAAGPTNLIAVTNVDIGVYNKATCSQVSRVGLTTLMGSAVGEILFDPQVLWDNTNGRFIVTAESEFSGNTDQNQWFAVSKDNTGTSWWVYRIAIRNGATNFCAEGSNPFWDYPHVGSVNGTNPQWMITANLFPSGAPDEGAVTNTDVPTNPYAALITFNKAPSFTGGTVTLFCFGSAAGMQFNLAPVNVLDSNSTAYLISPGSGSGSSIQRYALDTTTNTITTTSAITISAWTAAPNAAQPNGQTLDSLDGRFVSQTIQNGTNLWNVHNVTVGSVGLIRAYQLSTTSTSPVNTVTLSTTSIGSPTDHLFNASIATNATKAFVSVSRTIPSVAGTGNAAMLVLSGPNTLSGSWGSDLVATSASQYVTATGSTTCNNWSPRFTCRWGDNSSIQIDPSDNSQAWAFNQLITGTSQFNWTTRAALCCGSATPQLQVTPATDISASGPLGGPFGPASFNYSISSTSGSVNYTITGIPTWLNASFTSGTATSSPVTVTFSLQNVSSLNTGTYAATISFTNTTNGSGNTTRTATLTVTPDCALMTSLLAPPALPLPDGGPDLPAIPFPEFCLPPWVR